MSLITNSHDSICNCWHPFAHLLTNIFPPGHKDRDLTINQIIQRNYKEKCLSSDRGADDTSKAATITKKNPGTSQNKKERKNYIKDKELKNLITTKKSTATK